MSRAVIGDDEPSHESLQLRPELGGPLRQGGQFRLELRTDAANRRQQVETSPVAQVPARCVGWVLDVPDAVDVRVSRDDVPPNAYERPSDSGRVVVEAGQPAGSRPAEHAHGNRLDM